ncbi:phosphate/phosphite/phosphonate ABC transporter substrate-binding protein [Trinickia mobilis]|uniref:phosphate/phosphite/phosphonate ABC transporter substrate-binding protein n=1 Tax=Trinickia mobilis TaxID=2816356 RepID=UPI001A90AFFD|nr:PhnD/SsuA/transferrin family substrate-binding protein [Trinickia mobilis]
MTWIAALPMYNVSAALAADWRTLLRRVSRVLGANGIDIHITEPGDDLHAFWRRADLAISQTCGYPLMHGLREHVQLIATPHFDAPGCEGTNYRSVLVTGGHVSAQTLEACRGLRAAYNQDDSNSGMNVLRHAATPLSRDGAFFGSVLRTGSHIGSLRALAHGNADIASIDCVTMAFVRDHLPDLARSVREIGFSAASPGLPLIASRAAPEALVEQIRAALRDAIDSDTSLARRLRLKGFSTLSLADYARIEQWEDEARAAGYPRLG